MDCGWKLSTWRERERVDYGQTVILPSRPRWFCRSGEAGGAPEWLQGPPSPAFARGCCGAAAGNTVTVRGLVSQQTGSRRVCFYGQRANTAFPGQTRSSHGPSTTTCSLSTFISWAVFVDCIRFLSSNLTHGIWTRRRRRRTIYDHSISR